MFQAVRDFFGTAHGSTARLGATLRTERARRVARLFLFEFVVVVLGVLAAQLLQTAAQNRQARNDARLSLERSETEWAQMRAIGSYWVAVAPCLENHVTRIARNAADGRGMSVAQIGRPALPTPVATPWSDATILAARRAYGEDAYERYTELRTQGRLIAAYNSQFASDWAILSLLDPTFGNPSSMDRANVRLAAIRLRGQIRLYLFKAREILARTAGGSAVPLSVGPYAELANRCGMLRNW